MPLAMFRPAVFAQNFPGSPKFTEKDLPDLAGTVCLVSGANTGIGKELVRLLYGANATVYLACRSESKAQAAIEDIKKGGSSSSSGRLEFLPLDLSDLASVKSAAETFMAREPQLHVLINNAGVMLPPADTKTAQGLDMEFGTNCVGPFLLTELLTPALKAAVAATSASTPNKVRVVWLSSISTELYSSRGGVDTANLGPTGYRTPVADAMRRYADSKAGNYLHSVAYARRHAADGIISVAANPGNLDSDLYRTVDDQGFFQRTGLRIFTGTLLHPVVYGAYTELFAGFSPDVTAEKNGAWIGPWGRFFTIRKDIANAAKPKAEGGTGGADAFYDWTLERVKAHL